MSEEFEHSNEAQLRRRVAELESQLADLSKSSGSSPPHSGEREAAGGGPGDGGTVFMMVLGLIGLPIAFGYLGPADAWDGWSVPERVVVVGLFVAAWFGGVFLGRRFDEELHKEKNSTS